MPSSVYSKPSTAYDATHQMVALVLSTSTLQRDNTVWKKWDAFCCLLFIPTDLGSIQDPIPFLQIFMEWVRSGVLAAKRWAVQKCSVEKYLRYVGKISTAVGTPDPWLNAVVSLRFSLGRQLAAYVCEDPPPPLDSVTSRSQFFAALNDTRQKAATPPPPPGDERL